MDNINRIFLDNQKWKAEKLAEDPMYFKNLSEGQNPEYFFYWMFR